MRRVPKLQTRPLRNFHTTLASSPLVLVCLPCRATTLATWRSTLSALWDLRPSVWASCSWISSQCSVLGVWGGGCCGGWLVAGGGVRGDEKAPQPLPGSMARQCPVECAGGAGHWVSLYPGEAQATCALPFFVSVPFGRAGGTTATWTMIRRGCSTATTSGCDRPSTAALSTSSPRGSCT